MRHVILNGGVSKQPSLLPLGGFGVGSAGQGGSVAVRDVNSL